MACDLILPVLQTAKCSPRCADARIPQGPTIAVRAAARCSWWQCRLGSWPTTQPGWSRRSGPFASLTLILLLILSAIAAAQEEPIEGEEPEEKLKVELELLEREPFDELTLDAANDNTVLEIVPLKEVPANPKPTDRLRIHLLSDPDQAYEVLWRHIAKLRTYDEIVYDDAQRLMREKKYNEAFRNFDYLLDRENVSRELQHAALEYLLENAQYLVEQQQYQHALAILEEVTRREPTYRAAEVATRIAQVADTLIAAEVERDDYRKARGIIERLQQEYGGGRIESLGRWRQKLIDDARSLQQQARAEMEQGNYRVAERLSRQMVRIWPELSGANELRAEIARRYPMVIVGVAEMAGQQDVISVNSWPDRRTGRLTERTLVQFIGAGPEGGLYLCPLGEYYQSDDRRRLTLQLSEVGNAEGGVQADGYDVSKRVLAMADPQSPKYDPAWASLIRATRVEEVFQVQIDLRRPHVLPEAMLQLRLDVNATDPDAVRPSEGPYMLAEAPDDDVHFVTNPRYPFPAKNHPSEIVERYFATSEDAISALRRGDIDVIDYLFPDDAVRLQGDETLSVVPYALPTIHVLIPNYNNPFLANQTFRRAVLYGINRQAILESEVLGNNRISGCEVISGPFPIGTRDNDPLAYAYDSRIAPRAYYPRLASILKTLAHRSLREMAKKRDEEIPSEIRLVIGYPGNQIARVACQAITQYLQVIGVECELRELPPGTSDDPTGEVDLLYQQVAMWEPVIDARRLLAPKAGTAVMNEYVGMALRRLDTAKNWREVRQRLHDVHRTVHEQVAVIPLWQTVNYMVYSRRLSGIGPAPLTLYQDVEQWQVTPPDEARPVDQ